MLNESLRKVSKLPGPTGLKLWHWGMQVPTRPLDTYQKLRLAYGDMAYCPWKNRETLFLFHPDAIGHVLRDNHLNYTKGRDYAEMKPLLGEGLLLSEGALWRRQRQLMAKEFHHARVETYRAIIAEETNKLVHEWKQKGTESFDVAPLFMQATFDIACRIFFGQLLQQENQAVKDSLDHETLRVSKRIRRIFNLPRRFPTLENRRGEKAVAELNKLVSNIIATANPEANNVLSRLLNFKNDKGEALPARLIQNEVMTLMLAGHETTSNLLSWTVYLLGRNHQWQERCREDVSGQTLVNCLKESLRLYPPAPMISRLAKQDDLIAGYHVPAGTNVLTLQWVTHRDPVYWQEPEQFNPDRFNRPLAHHYAYFPFAFGPRSCIGEELAMVEAQVIMQLLLEQTSWKIQEGHLPVPVHHITLKPANGVWIKQMSH